MRGVAAHLDDRFHLLIGGRRTALPRHQTLRSTLDWSYDLLPERERVVFRRVSIFADGFGLKAATAVAVSAEIAASDVIDGVANLVAKSLVMADVPGATARYWLLETTRAYAREKLAESGELEQVARAHAQHYRNIFVRAQTEWETRPTLEWLAAYGRRIGDLRAALDWSFSPQGDTSIGIALTVASVPLWLQLSLMEECRGYVERALSCVGRGSDRDANRELRPRPPRPGRQPSRWPRPLTTPNIGCGRSGGYSLIASAAASIWRRGRLLKRSAALPRPASTRPIG